MDQISAAAPSGRLRSESADETRDIGRRLGEAATPGTMLALRGPLGAGKTQLAKGVAEGLGVTTMVNSPTFVLMNEHAGRLRLYHIDAYRLGAPDEALDDGLLDDRQASGVTVLEWADRLSGLLPAERLEIEIQPAPGAPSARVLRWESHGSWHAELGHRVLGPQELEAGSAAGS